MKYLYLGAAILAAILLFCVFSGSHLSQRFDQVTDPLERACEAYEQGRPDDARVLERQAADTWQRELSGLSAYLSHKDLDEITQAFSALQDAPQEDFLPECRKLLSMLYQVQGEDRPTLENLL